MPKNTLYQFAGMRSNLPNGITTENYIKALTMYNEGHSHKEVLKATGWFRGVDGAMRYEIPDNESSLDMDYLNRLKDGDFELLTLAAVLKHDKLYAAYPSLKHIRFKLSDFGGDTNTQGSWNQRNNCITMSNQLLAEPETLLDVLLHEIQHSIQSIEGYNMGGNTNDSFAASVEPSIQQNVKLAEQQLGEWMSNNSEAFRKAKEATGKARYARLFTSFRKLQKYSISQSPSRVKRHIENEGRWLYSDLLKKEGTNQTLEEAAKIELDWYNMPTKNNQNQKNAFLQKWAANCADVYLSQIPEKWKEEFLWAEGDFQKHANRYQAIADSLNKEIIDLKGVEDDLNAAKSSLRNYQEQLHTAETDKRKFLAPSASDLVYRHSAGEIEANNTMNRRQMTDEERLNKPFDMTHDIPTHKQIVYFRGSSYTSSQLSREVAQIKPKGSVTFEGKRFAEIILNKEADFSTIVHEGAHIYLEALTELAQHPTATQEIKQELNDILEWLEVDPKEWGEMDIHQRRDMHEVFAEGFESFVAKGGEDGLLTKIFDGFKKWISDIYQCLSNIPETKPLTASVNEVFAKATREVSPRSDFAIKLSKSIEQHSNMDEASALASSQIIDSSFNHLAGVAGLDREEFNKIFSINVVGVDPKAIHSKKMTL